MNEDRILPIIKWPGGKRYLLSQILPIIGTVHARYFEPFVGGAAVFLAMRAKKSYLSDSNPDLINFYTQVRDNCEELILNLRNLQNSEAEYYRIRESVEIQPVRRAARFMYLTSLSFNGIYRLNLNGAFNVPYGRKTHKKIYNPEHLRLVSRRLSKANLEIGDFETSVKNAKTGDTIYFDPPYTVAHGNNGFIKYNEKIFSWDDQIRLAKKATDLADSGCRVFVSNAFHPSVKDLYEGFDSVEVWRPSLIAANSKYRGTVPEYFFSRS